MSGARHPSADAPIRCTLARTWASVLGRVCGFLTLMGGFAHASEPPPLVALRFESASSNPLAITLTASARAFNFWPRNADVSLTSSAQPWFGLWLGDAKPNSPPLAGTYSLDGAQLRFRPSLPLLPGQIYTARLEHSGISLRAEYRTAASAPAAAPKLLAVYPTGDRLPANHLKFYLVFSEPMESGVFLRHCRLVDVTHGREVEAPFRETELWSPDGRRLTLWFHPGRQKTGVNLNLEFGPVLNEGGDYRLVIDGRWPSAHGVPLGDEVTKSFHAVPPLHEQLTVKNWQVHPPTAGTREPLRIGFPQPLDWATLHRMIRVAASSNITSGELTVERGEREWRWVPAQPWAAVTHEIRVDTALEDQAGNSLARPFEVNLLAPRAAPLTNVVVLAFTPR